MSKSFYDTIEMDNTLVFSDHGTVTEAINSFLPAVKGYNFFHITNDDVVYRTKGWDRLLYERLKDRPGIAYGNDLAQESNLCTFPFISIEIIKAVGWIQLPALKKYCGDLVWHALGSNLQCLHYCPDVIIEHLTWFNDKSTDMPDEKIYHQDLRAYAEWVSMYMDMDVLKIEGSCGWNTIASNGSAPPWLRVLRGKSILNAPS